MVLSDLQFVWLNKVKNKMCADANTYVQHFLGLTWVSCLWCLVRTQNFQFPVALSDVNQGITHCMFTESYWRDVSACTWAASLLQKHWADTKPDSYWWHTICCWHCTWHANYTKRMFIWKCLLLVTFLFSDFAACCRAFYWFVDICISRWFSGCCCYHSVCLLVLLFAVS